MSFPLRVLALLAVLVGWSLSFSAAVFASSWSHHLPVAVPVAVFAGVVGPVWWRERSYLRLPAPERRRVDIAVARGVPTGDERLDAIGVERLARADSSAPIRPLRPPNFRGHLDRRADRRRRPRVPLVPVRCAPRGVVLVRGGAPGPPGRSSVAVGPLEPTPLKRLGRFTNPYVAVTKTDQPAGRDATDPGGRRAVQRVATLWAAAAVLTFVAVLLVDRYVQHHGWAFTLAILWALTAPTAALLGRIAARWERRHPPTGTRRPHP